jgi:hypothetical protein
LGDRAPLVLFLYHLSFAYAVVAPGDGYSGFAATQHRYVLVKGFVLAVFWWRLLRSPCSPTYFWLCDEYEPGNGAGRTIRHRAGVGFCTDGEEVAARIDRALPDSYDAQDCSNSGKKPGK